MNTGSINILALQKLLKVLYKNFNVIFLSKQAFVKLSHRCTSSISYTNSFQRHWREDKKSGRERRKSGCV